MRTLEHYAWPYPIYTDDDGFTLYGTVVLGIVRFGDDQAEG
jgi:hypothetical protein